MKFQSMWGPTQYTNVLSIVPMLITAFVGTAAGCSCPPPTFDDSAPPASLDRLQAQAAPTHPGAPPEHLDGSLWPLHPA